MPKKDLTKAYIEGIRADANRAEILPVGTPDNRFPIGRMSWHTRFPETCSDGEFAETIQHSALEDAQFYVDTCFITGREVDERLWCALLCKTIVVTSSTWDELGPWLARPFVNRRFRDLLLQAREHGHPSIRFEEEVHVDSQIELAVAYYVQLLGLRKRAHELSTRWLRARKGRTPTDEEVEKHVQLLVKDRGYSLAKKGRAAKGKRNRLADEQLLVRAVVSAITTGHETTILTRDRDFIEQFYKLIYLVDTHYQGYTIGDIYSKQPLNFASPPWPADSEYIKSLYHSGQLITVPPTTHTKGVGKVWTFVMVYVCRFSPSTANNNFVGLAFCAEREIERMLRVKGATRGRNSASCGAHNVHRCVSPHLQEHLGSCAAITLDKGIEVGQTFISWVDVELALSRREGISRSVIVPPNEDGSYEDEIVLARNWAALRVDSRLSWTPRCGPIKVDYGHLSQTIEFLPLSCRLYADASFLQSKCAEAIAPSLKQAEFGTSEEIFTHITEASGLPKVFTREFQRGRLPPWLHVEAFSDIPVIYHTAAEQYYSLLSFRKQFGQVVRGQLQRAIGRMPTTVEWLSALQEIHGDHTDRALEADARKEDPSFFYEDRLITQVVLTSIVRGYDCVLLTSREIVLKQFVSLVSLLEQHYRSWCLANYFVDLGREGWVTEDESNSDWAPFRRLGFREFGPIRLISAETANRYLPESAIDVQLQCWLIRDLDDKCTFEPIGYLAEVPMQAMLRVRGDTEGLSTDQLGGDDITFLWSMQDGGLNALVQRGEPTWLTRGQECFPIDARIEVKTPRLAAKDFISIVNSCDYLRGVPAPS